MPNLWKFLTKAESDAPKVETYQFAEAEELVIESEQVAMLEEEMQTAAPCEDTVSDEAEETTAGSISYAQVQSDLLIQEAKQRADEIIRQADERAEQIAQDARDKAEKEGYQAGFQAGMQQALAENAQVMEARAQKLEEDVADFIKRAERALDRQLDENVDDLRDLALGVAEKIVCISLKSSTDVIGRMIQAAVDKRKRREWVHIYIAECDAKRLTSLPVTLTSALAELSDRVRIIPMADDEPGTCIIELPDEIVDASAATQMQNIRELLNHRAAGDVMTNFHFTDN